MVAIEPLPVGSQIPVQEIVLLDPIPVGHKLAVRDLPAGSPVRRYGQIIGFAASDIQVGQHVHTHNLEMREFARGPALGQVNPASDPDRKTATFLGYQRPNGSVGTRNYIAIIASVNCAATVARAIASQFSMQQLAAYPQIDGVIAVTHSQGCGLDADGEGMAILRRTLAGYACHPNFAGVLLVGLGCEQNQVASLLPPSGRFGAGMFHQLVIQTEGGTVATIRKGITLVSSMLARADAMRREPVSISNLVVGLQCGGSDGLSGITANPALGGACDMLIAHGATAVLSETPEIYGAEHLLTSRAASVDIARQLLSRVQWWKEYTLRNGGNMDNNPSVGNKAGGITTILEKALGAVAKGGTTCLNGVYLYAEPVRAKGLVFMDTPGYDPVSATGQAAGGAQIICFTTGRGSAFGCAGVPTVKLASNNHLFESMRDDMDINCGDALKGASITELSQRIFDAIIRHASGEKARSEVLGYGHEEFVPWHVGAVM
jgi:altronate hydrolase